MVIPNMAPRKRLNVIGTMNMVAKEGSASSILAQLMRFVLAIINTPTCRQTQRQASIEQSEGSTQGSRRRYVLMLIDVVIGIIRTNIHLP